MQDGQPHVSVDRIDEIVTAHPVELVVGRVIQLDRQHGSKVRPANNQEVHMLLGDSPESLLSLIALAFPYVDEIRNTDL